MKQNHFNRLLMLIVAFMTMCVTQVRGAEVTWNFSSCAKTANNAIVNTALNTSSKSPSTETGVWTAVTTANSFANTSSSFGIQLGSSSYSFNGTITLSNTSIPSGAQITNVKINAKSGGNYTVSCKVGTTTLGTNVTVNNSTAADYSFSGSVLGNSIVLTLSTSAKKYFALSSITVTYSLEPATIQLSKAGDLSNVSGTFYIGSEYTLPIELTPAVSCGSKRFVGWSSVEIAETNTKPTSNFYAPGATVTLSQASNIFYAVFATVTPGGREDATMSISYTENAAPTGWTIKDKGWATSYWGLASGETNNMQSPEIEDLSTITSIKVKMRTYGTTSGASNVLEAYSGSTTYGTQTATSTMTEYTITKSNSLSGKGSVYFKSQGTVDGAGLRVTDITINYVIDGSSYSAFSTTCGPSTYTASVAGGLENGSINLSKTNGSFAAGPLSDLAPSTTYYFQVTPNPNYHIQDGSVKVNNSTEGVTKVSGDANGAVYSYTTGSANMTISAAFDVNTFAVTAVSNDENMGTVRVDGMTITASPKQGYRVVADAGGYTVTAGTASVLHTGNSHTFTVTPSSDCTVRINFEAIPMTTINWVVGGQAYSVGTPTASIATGSQYSALTLPTAPADNTIGDCADHFMGWSTSNLGSQKGQSRPADLFKTAAGNTTVISGSEITFYAIFATGGGDIAFDNAFANRTVGNNSTIDLAAGGPYVQGDITFTFAKTGSETEPRQTVAGGGQPECIRLFGGNKMTVSVASGNITNIVLTKADGTNAVSANVGTLSGETWTGSASSVTFTIGGASGHNKYTAATVTTTSGGAAQDYVTVCGRKLYVQLPGDWSAASAKYAIYYWGGASGGWSEWMTTETSCGEQVRSAEIPEDATNVAFVRFDPTAGEPGAYGKEWNRTGDLSVVEGKDYYQSLSKGGDNKYYGTWSNYTPKMTITYTMNGHGDAIDNACVTKGGTLASLPTTPKCAGYIFDGWFTDNVTFRNAFTTSTVVNTNIEVFAKWTAVPNRTIYLKLNDDWAAAEAKYAIHYFTNGAGWSEFMTKGTGCYSGYYYTEIPGTETDINIARFNSSKAETGNWEDKWNQTQDLSMPLEKDLATITTKVGGEGADKNDYRASFSVFSLPTYTISFVGGDGATGSMDAISNIDCGSSQTIPANGFSKTGHRFAGWKDADENSYVAGAIIANISKDLTLTAQWETESYTLTWNLDGGYITAAGTAAGPVAYGTTLVAPTVEKDGYNFVAWSPTVAATMLAEAATYTATWTAASYGITYNLNDGSWNGAEGVATYTYGIGATLPTNVEKDGYRFDGWYDNESLTGDAISAISTTIFGVKTFWAKWAAKVAVQFSEQGTVADGKTVMAVPGETITLPSSSISACSGGYDTFAGWVIGEDFNETTTAPSTIYLGGADYTVPAGGITLKAVYTRCEGDGPEVYEKVTNMSEVANGTYIIATDKTYKNNSSTEAGKAYLAKSDGNTYSTTCNPTFDTEDANVITNSADAMEFTLTLGTGDKAGKFAISDGTYYLSAPNGNNITYSAIASGAVFDWEIMDGSTKVNSNTPVAGAIHSIGQSARFMQMNHNNGTPRFACYAATQKDAFLYKKTGGCTMYYATTPDCSTPENYTVTYKPNTENGGASHDDVVAEAVAWDEASTTKTVEDCGFTASNAAGVFVKWNTQADGSGDDYAEGAEIMNYNGTLYAIWENHYTVTLYDGDHSASSGSLRQEAVDGEVTLPSGTHGCPGDGNYTFAGWTTDANMYDDQAVSLTTIDAGGYVPTDDVNLYAVYSKSKITPDFALNCNGGNYNIGAQDNTNMSDSWNNSETELYTYEYAHDNQHRDCSKVFAIKKVAANVYTIQNESGEYLRASSYYALEFSTSTPDAAAKWTVSTGTNGDFRFTNNSYTDYALAKNGNNYKMTATSSITRTVYDLSLTPVNTMSYQSNPNCEAEHAITKAETTNGSFTVKDTEESPISIARNGATVVLAATPATGYQLGSWSVYKTEDEETTVTVTDNRFTMPDYDVTVAATFAPKNYTVTLNNNGATTAGAANVTATYGAMLPSIAGNLPVKTGYTFEGYYRAETQYINNAGAGVREWTTDGAGELTARWTEKTTSVTFYANNGSDPEENSGAISIAYASAADATFAPTKTSHRFMGYYTTREGEGKQIYDADKHMLKNVAGYTDATGWIYAEGGAALNLYARWEEVHFSVTYHVPSCQEAPATKDAVAEVGYTLPTMEAIYEYEFVGWHAGEAVSETTTRPTLLTGEYTPTGNVDLYAVYADGEYEDAMVGRLYANVNGTKKYLTGEPYVSGGGSDPQTIAVTETAASAQTYTITPTGSGVTISYVADATTKYLYVKKSSSSYYLQAQATGATWTVPATGNDWNGTYKFSNNGRYMLYQTSGNYVRAYADQNVSGTTYYALNLEETDSRFPVMTSATYKSEPDCSTKYVVTYDADGGVGEVCASQYYVADGFTVCAQTPTKEGYSFEGWNDGSTTYAAGAAYTLTQATTFTAQWGVVRVSSITIDQTEKAIEWKSDAAAPTFTLHVTNVAPANALDRTYTWRSSNTDVATVDETGKVTIVAGGTANIYAEANDGSGVKSGNCVVTVTRKYKVTFTALEGLTIKVDESATKTQWKDAGDAVALSVSVTNGYEWSAWDVTGATLNSEATVKDNGFTMPAGDVVVNATFTYKQDTYIDDMHSNVIDPETTKGKYTVPTLTEMPVSEGECETTHLHFVGWIEGEIGTDTQDTEPGGLVKPGGTKAATNKTYHAVWAERVE